MSLPVATNLYFDTQFERPAVKLLPNEFYVTREDMVLQTVLGSCVAACIQDRAAGIGGMNHFMLPDEGGDPAGTTSDPMRYGAYAMEVLLNELLKGGARRERLEAKVFGGAAVLAGMTTLNIGDRNAAFVRRYLALENVRITAEDLQGTNPRRVCFMPHTGQVMVKKLHMQQDLGGREAALARTLRERSRDSGPGHVQLFGKPPARPVPRVEMFIRPGAAVPGNPAPTRPRDGKTTMEQA